MDERSALILANIFICAVGLVICACRLGHMSERTTKIEIRLSYVIWVSTLVASSLSWTYGEYPSIAQVSMSLAIVAHLAMGIGAWRNGAPDYSFRQAISIAGKKA
jgi:hypothetical protein